MKIFKTINSNQKKETGFALLITLIVVGVVLSVGLTILDLSIKQVRLSTNAKDSEIAFHAANAGIECARYIRRDNSEKMVGVEGDLANHPGGENISVTCFEQPPQTVDGDSLADKIKDAVGGEGTAFQYKNNYEITWGSNQRCTVVNTIVVNAYVAGPGLDLEDMETLVPGYPDGDILECEPGSQCTVISVQGFNKSCTSKNDYGTVQREVLLQF